MAEPRRSKRRIAALLGAAVGIAVAAVIGLMAALRSVDWAGYRTPAERWLSDATGHDVEIEGVVGISLLPSPGIAVRNVAMTQGSGSGGHLLSIEKLALRFELLRLLAGELAFGAVDLRGVKLWLETDGEGRLNWTAARPRAAGEDPADFSFELATAAARDVEIVTSGAAARARSRSIRCGSGAPPRAPDWPSRRARRPAAWTCRSPAPCGRTPPPSAPRRRSTSR